MTELEIIKLQIRKGFYNNSITSLKKILRKNIKNFEARYLLALCFEKNLGWGVNSGGV